LRASATAQRGAGSGKRHGNQGVEGSNGARRRFPGGRASARSRWTSRPAQTPRGWWASSSRAPARWITPGRTPSRGSTPFGRGCRDDAGSGSLYGPDQSTIDFAAGVAAQGGEGPN